MLYYCPDAQMSQWGNRWMYVTHHISEVRTFILCNTFKQSHTHNTHLCTPFFSSLTFFLLLSFTFPSCLLPQSHPSFPSITSSLYFPYYFTPITSPFYPPHFTYSTLWMRVHYKNLTSPPGPLSRSDVVAWVEWRRCIHESRWCSPMERNREGGSGKMETGNWERRQGEEEKRRKGNGSRKGGGWGRQMNRGNVRGCWIDEWMFVHAAVRQMPIYYTKHCFKLNWCLDRGWRGKPLGFKACFHLQIRPEWSLKKTKINSTNYLTIALEWLCAHCPNTVHCSVSKQ